MSSIENFCCKNPTLLNKFVRIDWWNFYKMLQKKTNLFEMRQGCVSFGLSRRLFHFRAKSIFWPATFRNYRKPTFWNRWSISFFSRPPKIFGESTLKIDDFLGVILAKFGQFWGQKRLFSGYFQPDEMHLEPWLLLGNIWRVFLGEIFEFSYIFQSYFDELFGYFDLIIKCF